MIQHQRNLNMYPGVRIPERIHLSQYDSDFTLVFNLYSSAGSFSIDNGTTAMIRGTKGDGNGYSASATISGTAVTVQGNAQMTAVAGPNTFELVLTKNNKVLSTANFILDVEPAAMDANTIESDTVLMELQAIISGAETASQAAAQAGAYAAEAAESARTLTIDNTLTQAGQAADAKKTGDELGDLNDALQHNYVKLTDSQITINGITYTIDGSNGTISTSGISPSGWSQLIYFYFTPAESGQYYLSGCAPGGSTGTPLQGYRLSVWDITNRTYAGIDIGQGASLNLTAGTKYQFVIDFGANVNANGKVFRPVFIKSDRPIGHSISELYDRTDQIEGYSKKNLIKLEDSQYKRYGVTFTVDGSNGTITANGTVASGWAQLFILDFTPTESGKYYLSGCPAGGSSGSPLQGYRLSVWDAVDRVNPGFDIGQGVSLDLTAGHRYEIKIDIGTGVTVTDKVFSPMLVKGYARPFEVYKLSLDDLRVPSESSYINILSLGGKNDGSEDIGAIINRHTSYNSIYLPPGKYLVTTPITLYNSLVGAIGTRTYETYPESSFMATTLISGLQSGDVITVNGSSGAMVISDINIACANNESGILVHGTRKADIRNVTITGLGDGAKGIYTDVLRSGGMYLNNVSVYSNIGKTSVGIDLSATADCRISNADILYCQKSMILNGYHCISNAHLYIGKANQISKEWYDESCCIYCNEGSLIHATNLYTDSAFNMLYMENGSKVWVSNLMVWDDGTGSAHENTIHLTGKEGTADLWVNGGCYKDGGRISIGSDDHNHLNNFIPVTA